MAEFWDKKLEPASYKKEHGVLNAQAESDPERCSTLQGITKKTRG